MAQKGTMTQGTEWKHLILFALPLMGGHALQQLYNAVDGIVVGNYVGDVALAAVGACGPLTMLFVALAIGMSNGSAVVIGQYYGAGRLDEMRRAVSSSIILLIGLGAVLSVVGGLVARPVLTGVLRVSDTYIDYCVDYFAIYAFGLVFQFAYNVFAAVLRALGDSKATLYFLVISSVTNVVLDLLFVVVFHWAVAGAAIATIISQALSAVCAGVYMFRKHDVLRFRKGEFRFYGDSVRLTMKVALPNTLQQCIVSCGNVALQRIINDFGAVYFGLMAGATAGQRVESFIMIPIFSFNSAMATFTSQNIGAGRLERVKTGRRSGTVMSLCICAAVAVAAFLARSPLVRLFGVDDVGLAYGMRYLAILCPSLLIFCLHMVTAGVIQGSGDMRYAAILAVSSFAFRCVLAYILAYNTALEYQAVWFSLPAGWLFSMAMSWSRYYKGTWKTKAITRQKT